MYICFVATERSSTDDATAKFDNYDDVDDDDDVDDSGDDDDDYVCLFCKAEFRTYTVGTDVHCRHKLCALPPQRQLERQLKYCRHKICAVPPQRQLERQWQYCRHKICA